MTGSRAGVIGVKREQALRAFRTQMPVRFDRADEDIWVMGVAVEIGDDGLARGIDQILMPVPPRRLTEPPRCGGASRAISRNGRNQGM